MSDRASQEPDPERLAALEKRLAEAKRAQSGETQRSDLSRVDMAWRMVIEMVSGLGIGFGIGYGIDVLAGTLPLFMVLFTLLGLAAGIKVMIRSAQEMQNKVADDAAKEEGR